MIKVDTFSVGKVNNRNEDYFAYDKNNWVIADGATDKSGRKYAGKTGGELVAHIVVNECLSSDLNGARLVNDLNAKVKELYEKLDIIEDTKDAKYRFTCGFICVRAVDDRLIITYLGDLGFRINGTEIVQEKKQVDIDNSEARSKYIRKTKDVNGSRDHIMHLLLKQFEYQNNPRNSLGYGVIDGTKTPSKFVKTLKYTLAKIRTLELFTDGYFEIPNHVSITAWETSYQMVEKEDPDKWKRWKSTKSSDDRTVAIIRF